jgi:glycerol uptake facilitator protein
MANTWIGKYVGEALGVFLIVLFGCGLLFSAVLFGVVGDFYSAGMGWGLSVAIAVYVGASMSGAHFNPAVTLALAATGRFPWRQVPQYWIAQVLGGALGAVVLLGLFGPAFGIFATEQGLTIGQAGSEKLAMMLIPVSPHPWVIGIDQVAYDKVPIWTGFLAEALCTGILVMFILALLERRSVNGPAGWFFPFALALLVCMIVIIDGPLTMTSLNPARDLGPRIVAAFMGFGTIAFPGVRDGGSLLVTAGAPFVGAVIGAVFFDRVVKPFYPAETAVEPASAPVAESTSVPAAA